MTEWDYLATTSFWDVGIEANSLSIFIHLTKLVEAVHLIDVREINHIGGNIKNRSISLMTRRPAGGTMAVEDLK